MIESTLFKMAVVSLEHFCELFLDYFKIFLQNSAIFHGLYVIC